MNFARIVFYVAFVWGVLVLTPLFFMFDIIGRQDPPPITHPGFYYGFVTAGLTWQFVFLVIARNPVRFRPLMLLSVLEKFGYSASLVVLYAQRRLHSSDMVFAATDGLLGIFFLFAFFKTGSEPNRS